MAHHQHHHYQGSHGTASHAGAAGGVGVGGGTTMGMMSAAAGDESRTSSAAVSELEHFLSVLPPPGTAVPPHQVNNPVAVAHAGLQYLRDVGDPRRLFLRSMMELIVWQHPHPQQVVQVQQSHAAGQQQHQRHDVHQMTMIKATVVSGREELFFHCVTGFRQVVLWHWPTSSSSIGTGNNAGGGGTGGFSRQLLTIMRDYLMVVGHSFSDDDDNPSSVVRTTCRLACYTTSVAMWKRGWDDQNDNDGGKAAEGGNVGNTIGGDVADDRLRPDEEGIASVAMTVLQQQHSSFPLRTKQDLFRYLEMELFPKYPERASTLCCCLGGEFCGKSAASVSYRLPLEFHKSTHMSFEKLALLPILQLAMTSFGNVIGRIVNVGNIGAAVVPPAHSNIVDPSILRQCQATTKLLIEVLGWEFGLNAWSDWKVNTNMMTTLILPPVEWIDVVARPDLVSAVFQLHNRVVVLLSSANAVASTRQQQQQLANELPHDLRQLLLQLASLSGSIFIQPNDKKQFASTLMEGTVKLLESSSALTNSERPDLLDTLQLATRIVSNFRLSTLVDVPMLVRLLQGMTKVGLKLLHDQTEDCRRAGGDADSMEHRDFREEALSSLLECAVLLCGDPWILYSGTEEARRDARNSLSSVLGPLYEGFVQCRIQMAAMEEHYAMTNAADLDEVREQILETDLEEEMSSIATVGRLNLSAAIRCLSNHFGRVIPSVQALWERTGDVTPDTAALLEESRMLTMYICHLLTDNNEGESPTIPDAIVITCEGNPGLVDDVASAVQALFQFAESHAQKVATDPANLLLSPLLGRSFLWFLNRWAPSYVYPSDQGPCDAANRIIVEWSTPEKAQQIVTACVSLCLHYQCYWPHEQVQEASGRLLMSLAKRGGQVRSSMVASPVFQDMVRFHCLTAATAHSANHQEFEAAVRAKLGNGSPFPSMNMVWGYHRLHYDDKARILTSILVTCSDPTDSAATAMLRDSLKAVHDAFTSLVTALASNQVMIDDVSAKEMSCLCVEMFCGVAHASEMLEPERIPQFVNPYLPQLSGLMKYYAKDLTICESLLRFFRDYTEQFIALLDPNQSLSLFNASAELLKSYSVNHCEQRVIEKKTAAEVEVEEEQAYGDILCALQLLTNLAAKDFIDACRTTQEGVTSSQVTDVIFFGLQQILPLMTQGLLQYPLLCSQFFELVGFMMDTYPEKVCALPYEVFNSLLESLMFGMSHHSVDVGRPSLQGIASIAKEHVSSQALAPHLSQHPDIFDTVSRRLLSQVVFQSVVIDRMEVAGYAILPLAAIDINRFGAVVQDLSLQVTDELQRARLQAAFRKLIQPETVGKVVDGGYEGRVNRVRFKKAFEEFVNEIHSFLVLR